MFEIIVIEPTNSNSNNNAEIYNDVHLSPVRNISLPHPCVRQCRAGIRLPALFDSTRDYNHQ
jgi:hypothetical protein